MPLTSRERVLTVLNHEVPDRVPVFIGASNATGISMPTYRKLKQLLGVNSEERYLYDWPELGTAAMDETILERLHSDVRGVLDREPAFIRGRIKLVKRALPISIHGAWALWKAIPGCGFPRFIRSQRVIPLPI